MKMMNERKLFIPEYVRNSFGARRLQKKWSLKKLLKEACSLLANVLFFWPWLEVEFLKPLAILRISPFFFKALKQYSFLSLKYYVYSVTFSFFLNYWDSYFSNTVFFPFFLSYWDTIDRSIILSTATISFELIGWYLL